MVQIGEAGFTDYLDTQASSAFSSAYNEALQRGSEVAVEENGQVFIHQMSQGKLTKRALKETEDQNVKTSNIQIFNSALIYHGRGVAYAKLGHYSEAIADYSKAIELNPNYVIAYYNFGLAKAKLGDFESAVRFYTQAIELAEKQSMPDLANAMLGEEIAA